MIFTFCQNVIWIIKSKLVRAERFVASQRLCSLEVMFLLPFFNGSSGPRLLSLSSHGSWIEIHLINKNNNNNNSITSQKISGASITKTSGLMLFKEIIHSYCENHTKHVDTLCEQNAKFFNNKAAGRVTTVL